jgi:addiction module RelE/StbE family toxin
MFFHPTARYTKEFRLLSKRKQRKANERLEIFKINPFDRILNNHQLHGEYEGCRSINVTGSLRIIYKDIGDSNYILMDIGTHSQLYE